MPSPGRTGGFPGGSTTSARTGLPGGNSGNLPSVRRDIPASGMPSNRPEATRGGWSGSPTSGRTGLPDVAAARRDFPVYSGASVNRTNPIIRTNPNLGNPATSPFGSSRTGAERVGMPATNAAARARESLGLPGRNTSSGRALPSQNGVPSYPVRQPQGGFPTQTERVPGRGNGGASPLFGGRDGTSGRTTQPRVDRTPSWSPPTSGRGTSMPGSAGRAPWESRPAPSSGAETSPFGRSHSGYSGGSGLPGYSDRRTTEAPRSYSPPIRPEAPRSYNPPVRQEAPRSYSPPFRRDSPPVRPQRSEPRGGGGLPSGRSPAPDKPRDEKKGGLPGRN